MSRQDFLRPFPWVEYSKKVVAKVENPLFCGMYTYEEARERGMRLVIGREGLIEDGNVVHLFFLVDESDGIIADAKYQVFGQTALIAVAEAACALAMGKNYDQVKRLSADLIDKQLRDKEGEPALPTESLGHLNLVLSALDDAVEHCLDIPLPTHYVSPVPKDIETKETGGYPGWIELREEQKLAVIEQIFDDEIRPYIELDAGGIKIQELVSDKELIISYQGTCTSCFSSIGATLSTIQQIVHSKIHPELKVIPNMDDLDFAPGHR